MKNLSPNKDKLDRIRKVAGSSFELYSIKLDGKTEGGGKQVGCDDRSTSGLVHVLVEELGAGGFSTVMKGTLLVPNAPSPLEVAVKKIRTVPQNPIYRFVKKVFFSDKYPDNEKVPMSIALAEKEILRELQGCKYVLTYFGYYQSIYSLWLVLENCCPGDLEKLTDRKFVQKSDARTLVFVLMVPIMEALAYMHKLDLVHRDVKPSNILLTWEGVPKLADFGLVAKKKSGHILAEGNYVDGSPFFMAPEIVLHESYTEKVDSWSLGISMVMLSNDLRTSGIFFYEDWDKVCRNFYRWSESTVAGEEGMEFLKKQHWNLTYSGLASTSEDSRLWTTLEVVSVGMLSLDQKKRKTISELLKNEEVVNLSSLWKGEQTNVLELSKQNFDLARKLTLEYIRRVSESIYEDIYLI